MRIAAPGNFVLSYAHGRVGHVGVITGRVIHEGKPVSFGSTGQYWSNDGWWLPVNWTPLPNPFTPKTRIDLIRQWLPERYSPIRLSSGEGNQGAYLAEISSDLFFYVISQSDAAVAIDLLGAELDIDQKVPERLAERAPDLGDSTQQQVIQARRGQGLFRFRVSQLEPACRVTKITTPGLLIASHMKPWSSCATTSERLDGANGLLLTPHVDKLFDKGLIGFTDTGAILKSDWLKQDDVRRLGLEAALQQNVGAFSAAQLPYLEHHRNQVFGLQPN